MDDWWWQWNFVWLFHKLKLCICQLPLWSAKVCVCYNVTLLCMYSKSWIIGMTGYRKFFLILLLITEIHKNPSIQGHWGLESFLNPLYYEDRGNWGPNNWGLAVQCTLEEIGNPQIVTYSYILLLLFLGRCDFSCQILFQIILDIVVVQYMYEEWLMLWELRDKSLPIHTSMRRAAAEWMMCYSLCTFMRMPKSSEWKPKVILS